MFSQTLLWMNTDHLSIRAPSWALSGTPKAKQIPKINKDNVKGEEEKEEGRKMTGRQYKGKQENTALQMWVSTETEDKGSYRISLRVNAFSPQGTLHIASEIYSEINLLPKGHFWTTEFCPPSDETFMHFTRLSCFFFFVCLCFSRETFSSLSYFKTE